MIYLIGFVASFSHSSGWLTLDISPSIPSQAGYEMECLDHEEFFMSDLVLTTNRHNMKINEQDDYDYSFSINCLVLQIFSVLKHV